MPQVVRAHRGAAGIEGGLAEEVAWRMGFLSDAELAERAQPLVESSYGQYVVDLLDKE